MWKHNFLPIRESKSGQLWLRLDFENWNPVPGTSLLYLLIIIIVIIKGPTYRFVKGAPDTWGLDVPNMDYSSDSSTSDETCITAECSTMHVRLQQQFLAQWACNQNFYWTDYPQLYGISAAIWQVKQRTRWSWTRWSRKFKIFYTSNEPTPLNTIWYSTKFIMCA